MLIAFEGPDLVGKTTQAKMLVDRLRSAGHEVLHLDFPGKSEFGLAARACFALRDLPLTGQTQAVVRQACLLADRYALRPEIDRHIVRGHAVIIERWTLSGVISGEADGVDVKTISAAQAELIPPDLEIVLLAPIDVLRDRARARGGPDRYERDDAIRRKVLMRYSRTDGVPPNRLFFNGDADREGLAKQIWGYVATLLRRKWS